MRPAILLVVLVFAASVGCKAKREDRGGDDEQPAPGAAVKVATSASGNAAAIARLRAIMTQRYSHRDRLGIDWDREIEKHDKALESAGTPAEFGFATAALLAVAKDIHITVSVGPASAPIATHRDALAFNFDIERSLVKITSLEQLDDCIAVGDLGDDIGYLLLKSFVRAKCPRFATTLLTAWKRISGRRALIVDARANTGGDELLARQVASRFMTSDVFYAQHEDGPPLPGGRAGMRHRRRLMAALPRQRFTGPVALLIGPANMSSAEAFILMMMQATNATTIGARTYGSSGNPIAVELGNGVTVNLPSWRAFTIEGAPLEGVGIEPAIALDWGEAGDPIIDAAVAHLGLPRRSP